MPLPLVPFLSFFPLRGLATSLSDVGEMVVFVVAILLFCTLPPV